MSARNEKTALAGGLFEGDTELTLLSPGNGSVRGKQLPKVPASLAVTCRIFQANSLSTPVTEGHHLWRFVVPARIGSMSLLPLWVWLVGQNGEISHTAQRAIAHHSRPGLAILGQLQAARNGEPTTASS